MFGAKSEMSASSPPIQQPTEAIHVVGRMTVGLTAQERSHFKKITKILFQKTKEIDKPLLYTCNADINSPGTFVWDEIWASKQQLDAHLSSDHFKIWWGWVEPHLVGQLQVSYVLESDLKPV